MQAVSEKLLQKIEGVDKVEVDSGQQKFTLSGNVHSSALIKKLLESGKYAELWSQKSNQNQKSQQTQCIKADKNTKDQKDCEALKKPAKPVKPGQQPQSLKKTSKTYPPSA